jgi:hypothetical protein
MHAINVCVPTSLWTLFNSFWTARVRQLLGTYWKSMEAAVMNNFCARFGEETRYPPACFVFADNNHTTILYRARCFGRSNDQSSEPSRSLQYYNIASFLCALWRQVIKRARAISIIYKINLVQVCSTLWQSLKLPGYFNIECRLLLTLNAAAL